MSRSRSPTSHYGDMFTDDTDADLKIILDMVDEDTHGCIHYRSWTVAALTVLLRAEQERRNANAAARSLLAGDRAKGDGVG